VRPWSPRKRKATRKAEYPHCDMGISINEGSPIAAIAGWFTMENLFTWMI